MKNFIFLIFILLFFNLNISGQKVKPVPVSVKKAFSLKYPKIKRVIWDNSSVKLWEAEFRMNGNEYSVLFELNGAWIKTEHEIGKSEIPSDIRGTLSNEFAGYKIIESLISENPKSKVYKIGIKKENEKLKVTLDKNGKVLKKESGKEMEDEDEIENESDSEE